MWLMSCLLIGAANSKDVLVPKRTKEEKEALLYAVKCLLLKRHAFVREVDTPILECERFIRKNKLSKGVEEKSIALLNDLFCTVLSLPKPNFGIGTSPQGFQYIEMWWSDENYSACIRVKEFDTSFDIFKDGSLDFFEVNQSLPNVWTDFLKSVTKARL